MVATPLQQFKDARSAVYKYRDSSFAKDRTHEDIKLRYFVVRIKSFAMQMLYSW